MSATFLLILLGLAGAVAAGLWLTVLGLEWTNVFRPERELPATPGDAGLRYEDVDFVASDGRRLHGWWMPAPEASATLIYLHGNAGNIGTRIETYVALHRLGLNLFTFDYRGYGRSRGLPSERGIRQDALAAYEVVRARHADVEHPPVLLYGRSLGGAVALQLAVDRPVLAVAVEAAFSSMIDMAAHRFPLLPYRLFGRYRFDALDAATRVAVPLLVAHSRDDRTVPFEMGRHLFEAASEPKQFVALSGPHGEPGWMNTPGYFEQLRTFLQRAQASATGS